MKMKKNTFQSRDGTENVRKKTVSHKHNLMPRHSVGFLVTCCLSHVENYDTGLGSG